MPRVRIRSAAPLPESPAIEPVVSPEADEGSNWGGAALGALGLAGAGLAASKFGGLAKFLRGANTLRQQAMLSGMAPFKSVLGNIGATAIASAERGTMAPLRELFSMQTVKDAARNYRANIPYPGTTKLPDWLPTPGRFMGAADEATQGALRRAGLSAEDAAREVLQAPLPGKLAESLEGPVAQYLIPFRRTPFNQLMEGLKAVSPENVAKNPGTLAAIGGAGLAHGAVTADDRMPLSIGLGTALASRYGLPYAVAAMIGRHLTGGKGSGSIPSSILPVSEYGITSAIEDPLKPFLEPAAVTALRRLAGGE